MSADKRNLVTVQNPGRFGLISTLKTPQVLNSYVNCVEILTCARGSFKKNMNERFAVLSRVLRHFFVKL